MDNINKWQQVRDRQHPYNTDAHLQKGSFPWRDLVEAGNALLEENERLKKQLKAFEYFRDKRVKYLLQKRDES